MKASEAIKFLQEAIEKHGDIAIYKQDPEYCDYYELNKELVFTDELSNKETVIVIR